MAKLRNRDGSPRVVVVGGGFAGLRAVKTLNKIKPPVRATLLGQGVRTLAEHCDRHRSAEKCPAFHCFPLIFRCVISAPPDLRPVAREW